MLQTRVHPLLQYIYRDYTSKDACKDIHPNIGDSKQDSGLNIECALQCELRYCTRGTNAKFTLWTPHPTDTEMTIQGYDDNGYPIYDNPLIN